ncbi:MAG TPA: YdeI/OmpD-associated family protein [Flavipsychrobacter sp.]|nr:YdeI/OmpD-associated family protein [Flavipsychrobacter sp.]
MKDTPIETFHPASQKDWRKWLQKHHASKQSVWLIYYKQSTGKPSLSWSDAVDEALCFGWIDSTARPVDEERYMQYFCRRKPSSVWSRINKEKVERLIANGQMTQAGLDSINIAKQNGSWTSIDAVEALEVPKELAKALSAHKGAKACFESLSKSVKKQMLHRIAMAKRPETRTKRIDDIVAEVLQKMKK